MKRYAVALVLILVALPLMGMAASNGAFDTHNKVRAALQELVLAYNSKNISMFMNNVSDSYTGEKRILDSRLRSGFSRIHDIDLRYNINNITSDSDGKLIYVSVNYTKSYTDIRTTKRMTKMGVSELIFEITKEGALLYSIRRDNMFGSGGR